MNKTKINPGTEITHFSNPYIGERCSDLPMKDVSNLENVEKYLYTPEQLIEKVKKPFTIQLTIFHELARKLKQ